MCYFFSISAEGAHEFDMKIKVKGNTRAFCNMDGKQLLQVLENLLGVPEHLINITGVHDGCIEITFQVPQKWNDIDVCKKLKEITTCAITPDWLDQAHYRIIGIRPSKDTDYIIFCKYMYIHGLHHIMF